MQINHEDMSVLIAAMKTSMSHKDDFIKNCVFVGADPIAVENLVSKMEANQERLREEYRRLHSH